MVCPNHLPGVMLNPMKRTLLGALAGCVLLLSPNGIAQDRGMWRAARNTAKSITGDIAFFGEKLSVNFSTFTVAEIRALTPAELSIAFNPDDPKVGEGHLYRTSIPGDKKFLHKNTLCGSEDTQWIVTYVSGKTLELAFFSTATMPVFTPEAFNNSSALCGTFTYVR